MVEFHKHKTFKFWQLQWIAIYLPNSGWKELWITPTVAYKHCNMVILNSYTYIL
jgi:hypothetical protein